MPRIAPLTPPYPAEAAAALTRMMPPGMEPIALFRVLVRNPTMADPMTIWGSYELGPALLALAGWYHAISYLARATRRANEPGAPAFADVAAVP